jgi:hypothetical protein
MNDQNTLDVIKLANFQLSLKMLSAQADICSHFATPESIGSTSFISTFSDLKKSISDVLEKINTLRTDKNKNEWAKFDKQEQKS